MAEEVLYTREGINELSDTVDLMLSEDYKERFVAEYYQLEIRIRKLDKFLRQFKQGELDFKPDCSIDVLERQLDNMIKYAKTLEVRAEIESIKL